MKRRINQYTNCVEEVRSDKSGSNDSAYTFENQFVFHDNQEGDPKKFNAGFDIRPLDKEIYGGQAALESERKFALKTAGNTHRSGSNPRLPTSARRNFDTARNRVTTQGDVQSSIDSFNHDFK